MSRYLCIACEVFSRPIYHFAAISPHTIDIQILERGLHNEPAKLRENLQESIDKAEGRGYSGILLAYGLCGNGSSGLQTRSIPLVVPRVHDCIAMFLGSRERYNGQFTQNPGTYWFTQDSFERKDGSGNFQSMGLLTDAERENKLAEFTLKYGPENAEYLMDVMGAWQSKYNRLVYIDTEISTSDHAQNELELEAKKQGWFFEALSADLVLFRKLLHAEWDKQDPDFIIVPPGKTLQAAFDDCIFMSNDEV